MRSAPSARQDVAAAFSATVPKDSKDQAAGSVLAYRLGMPTRKQPTAQDAATARRILLDGLAGDSEAFELVGELEPLHPPTGSTPPGR